MARKRYQLNVELPEGLAERLKAHSESTGVPQARIVRDALEESLVHVYRPAPTPPPLVPMEEAPSVDPERVIPVEAVGLTPSPKGMGRGEVGAKPRFKCPTPGCSHTSSSDIGYCKRHDKLVVPE